MFISKTVRLCCARFVSTILLAILLLPDAVSAHPHSWIVLETQINITDDHISSLSMSWEFDAMTSAYMLSDEDINDTNTKQQNLLPQPHQTHPIGELHRQAILDTVANEVIQNLLSTHYFTYFYQANTPIRYKKVEHSTLTLKRAKLTLQFDLELATPISIFSPDLRLLIFDPTYFIDMSWENKHAVNVSPTYHNRCHIQVIEPNPSPAQVAYAMLIPIDAAPDNALGQLFTQKAIITCTEDEH